MIGSVTRVEMSGPANISRQQQSAATQNGLQNQHAFSRESSVASAVDSQNGAEQQPTGRAGKTDYLGVQVEDFIKTTLKQNSKARMLLLKLELVATEFLNDAEKQSLRFLPAASYQRMLIHRVATLFGFEHNVDSTRESVVISKTTRSSVPVGFRFRDFVPTGQDMPVIANPYDIVDTSYILLEHGASSSQETASVPKQVLLTSLVGAQTAAEAEQRQSFSTRLCNALVKSDIPLGKVSCPAFREFLECETKQRIPDESTLRKLYLASAYEDTVSQIRKKIGESSIYVEVDEYTDNAGRKVANFIVGSLDTDKPGIPYLLACTELERTNQHTMAQFFDTSLKLLWPSGIKYERVLVLVTDAAAYMKAFGRLMKQSMYPDLIHVTCCTHALHDVCEKIRVEFDTVDEFIATVAATFLKSPSRLETFRTCAPNVPLPPKPLLTRWGTWISAANYYTEHYETIKLVLEQVHDRSECARKAKELILRNDLKQQLAFVSANYGFIPDCITALENSGLSLTESLAILNGAIAKVRAVSGKTAGEITKKLDAVFGANEGLLELQYVNSILRNEEAVPPLTLTNRSRAMLVKTNYSPICSCDVERRFSRYRAVFRENRGRFDFENISRNFVVICFPN